MPHELPCGQTQTVQAHYTLNGHALQTLKELVFYYLVRRKASWLTPHRQEPSEGQRTRKLLRCHYFDLLSVFLLKVWLLFGLIIASSGSIKQEWRMKGKTWGVRFLSGKPSSFSLPFLQIMAKGGIVRTGTYVLPVKQGGSEYFHNSTFLPHSDTVSLTLQKYQK